MAAQVTTCGRGHTVMVPAAYTTCHCGARLLGCRRGIPTVDLREVYRYELGALEAHKQNDPPSQMGRSCTTGAGADLPATPIADTNGGGA